MNNIITIPMEPMLKMPYHGLSEVYHFYCEQFLESVSEIYKMKKMICGILAAFSFLYLIPMTINSANASNVNIEDELIVTLLNSYTMEAIQKYYGELRGYDINNAKVNKILKATSGENVYQVEIHITTYVGPFNPPYGNDILFFTATPAFVRLDKYEHKD